MITQNVTASDLLLDTFDISISNGNNSSKNLTDPHYWIPKINYTMISQKNNITVLVNTSRLNSSELYPCHNV